MIVAIHQPAYLPWLGYLERIAMSDVFVFLDTVQYEKNSFTNRNLIKTSSGSTMLTIPVLKQGHIDGTLAQLKIDTVKKWRDKHLRSVELNYRKSKNFDLCWPKFSSLYTTPMGDNFSDLTYRHLKFWIDELKIDTKIVRSSELEVGGKKTELLVEICSHFSATRYISGPHGKEYLDFGQFETKGIELSFHDFKHPTYDQLYGQFIPGMGVVDYWMNDGSPEIFKNLRSYT